VVCHHSQHVNTEQRPGGHAGKGAKWQISLFARREQIDIFRSVVYAHQSSHFRPTMKTNKDNTRRHHAFLPKQT
jgi:hypothetical protein